MPRSHLAHLGIRDAGRSRSRANAELAHAYPRPLLRRREWWSLNGAWEFALDADGRWRTPGEPAFERHIEVPFAPETRRSGIGETGLYKAVWYRRRLRFPALETGQQLLLHFGAVDYHCRVWVDGRLVGEHEGGYTPFHVDVSELTAEGEHEIVVHAEDDPLDLAKPRGKQDWQLEPHSIWYPRTTGIWQTVWLERVNRTRISELRWTPTLESWSVTLDALLEGTERHDPRSRLWLEVRLHVGDLVIADDRYAVVAGEVHRRLALSDPGIDDFRNELLWSPKRPTLIEAELTLLDVEGRVLDFVESYTALRQFAVDKDRFVLNGRPYPLRMVLDQGYWPDTGLTPPDDAALRKDVELTKAMGFNGARKHQKIEDPRYLYWADRLGLLVWEEMPSAYRFTRRSVERLSAEWLEAMRRDISHPCIVAWVPFNESWGVPNLPSSQAQRHYVEALYHLTKTIDPCRPVVGNDGWESVATDILGIHDYDKFAERIRHRYATHELRPKVLGRERPGGRALMVSTDPSRPNEHPIVLSEFGGIALANDDPRTWGYDCASSPDDLRTRYQELLRAVRSLELLAGFCYTQLTDTYQEANGLLFADRTPKLPLQQIAQATAGTAEYVEEAQPLPIEMSAARLTEGP
jgi:beta-galactosidase/beta-glucuronidase